MRYSEAKWKKWYLDQTGTEWKEEDDYPDTSSWTPAQKKVGETLWARYVEDKAAKDELSYQTAQNRADVERAKRDAIHSNERLSRAFNETSQATRMAGLGVADSVRAEQTARLNDTLQTLQKEGEITRRKLYQNYAQEAIKADEAVGDTVAEYEAQAQAESKAQWNALKKELSADLEYYRSRLDDRTYSQEGVDAIKSKIESRKEELGSSYDEAIRWIEELPTYRPSSKQVMVTTYLGEQIPVNRWDYDLADAVTYTGGAGSTVGKIDVFKVKDGDTTYTIKGGDYADEETDQLLKAIA